MLHAISRITLALVVLLAPIAMASEEAPQIRKITIPRDCLWTRDGAVLYQELCSVCHGQQGHGNGPAAELVNPPPTDLTLLASNHEGKFPSTYVLHAISGRYHQPVAGSAMPSWEELFADITWKDSNPLECWIVT